VRLRVYRRAHARCLIRTEIDEELIEQGFNGMFAVEPAGR
jgi:hypothetical protein